MRMENETDYISRKKELYPVSDELVTYLKKFKRYDEVSIKYDDLNRYSGAVTLYDKNGDDSLWETIIYDQWFLKELDRGLKEVYAILKMGKDLSVCEHLKVDRVDCCRYGNTKPFRIKINNKLNDNHDYFYIKKIDSSRVYGLEIEHLLSPSMINFFVFEDTLVEEHIAGIPGDQFVTEYLNENKINKIRIAKEFVKFNERCFVRLLGDMRSYNYVIDITPDFDNEQYRIRAIDFDQQSYEGKKVLYLPQFIKENNAFVKICIDLMTPKTVHQYQQEERSLMRRRALSSKHRFLDLFEIMEKEVISTPQKIAQLKEELNKHFKTTVYSVCTTMGQILKIHLTTTLDLKDYFD